MSTASVLLARFPGFGGTQVFAAPVHRPGDHRSGTEAALSGVPVGAWVHAFRRSHDIDLFDRYCDHLLVRDDDSGEFVGCYRMLPPPGAIAAGGLYTATEFDIAELDPLRDSLVEMGRAVVRGDHRNGAVVLLMWAESGLPGPLRHNYVAGCVSVPIEGIGEPFDTRSEECTTS